MLTAESRVAFCQGDLTRSQTRPQPLQRIGVMLTPGNDNAILSTYDYDDVQTSRGICPAW